MSYYAPSVGGFPMPQGNYSPMPQTAPTGQPGFTVRPVASREEAMAIQTDFFGPGIIMPCLGHGIIWLKRFNANTGASDLIEFVYAPPQPQRQEQYVPLELFQKLAGKVEQLEKGMVNRGTDHANE